MSITPVDEGLSARLATVNVGDTWKYVEPPRFPTTIELVVVGTGCSLSFPPTAVGVPLPGLFLVRYQPRTEAPTIAWKTGPDQRTTTRPSK